MASKIGQQEAELIELGEGVQASLPPGASLAIEGTTLAKKAYQDALAARLAITVEARTFSKALKVALKQYYGSQNPVLEAFGIPIDKLFIATQEQKALANARRAQTRVLRGTLGRRAKLAATVNGAGGLPPASPPPARTLSEAVVLVARRPIADEEE
jgi:hypothetical protein